MTLEELFQQVDNFFQLARLPRLCSMLIFLVVSVVFFTLLLRFLFRTSTVDGTKEISAINIRTRRIKDAFLRILLPVSVLVLIYRVVQLLLSIDRTASAIYVSSSVLAAILIMTNMFFSYEEKKEKLLIFVVILFVVTGPVLETSMLNGAKLYETTKDSMNIFINGHWNFSYQHPIYDALPVDAVFDVLLTNVLGLREPTNSLLTAISGSCVAATTVLFVVLFCRFLGFSTKVGLLASMAVSSLPYLQFTVPPTNYSSMFVIMFIALLAKSLSTYLKRRYTFLSFLLLGCAILAHEMSVLVLFVPLVLFLFNSYKDSYAVRSCLLKIVSIGAIIALSINLYTRALPATYSYAYTYVQGLLRNPTIASTRVSSFSYVPVSIQLVYLLPIALVGAYVVNLLLCSIFRNQVPISGRSSRLLMTLYAAAALAGFLAGISLVGTVPVTRHFGLFAYLCIGLGTAAVFAAVTGKGTQRKRSRLPARILICAMIMIVALSSLTPHEMPDQYSHSAAERGGILEDYIVCEFLANHAVFSGKIEEVSFIVHTLYYTKYTLEQALSISRIKHALLAGIEKPASITIEIYYASDLNLTSSRDLESKSLVFNSIFYEVFANLTIAP